MYYYYYYYYHYCCLYSLAELNTGVMLMRNTDWSRQFIGDVARLGRMHVNHWQLMDEVMHKQARVKLLSLVLPHHSLTVVMQQTSNDALSCAASDQLEVL